MESFAAKSHAEFLGVLRLREAVDDPPLIVTEDAAMPLAHREVEAEGIHESTMRARALGRWERDLVWPAAINRGSAGKSRRECIGTFGKIGYRYHSPA